MRHVVLVQVLDAIHLGKFDHDVIGGGRGGMSNAGRSLHYDRGVARDLLKFLFVLSCGLLSTMISVFSIETGNFRNLVRPGLTASGQNTLFKVVLHRSTLEASVEALLLERRVQQGRRRGDLCCPLVTVQQAAGGGKPAPLFIKPPYLLGVACESKRSSASGGTTTHGLYFRGGWLELSPAA